MDSFDVDKHDVNSIFIDETEINVGWKKAMGSIRTSTKSVSVIPHKLAPELPRCILFHKEACKELWQEDYLHRALWY
ncbi:MAG: hypothetical protein RXO34_03120, partial [Nitrososphaeria archaeon]